MCNGTGTATCDPTGTTTSTCGKGNVGGRSSSPTWKPTSTHGNDNGGSGSRQGGYIPIQNQQNLYRAREVPDPEEQQAALEEANGDE